MGSWIAVFACLSSIVLTACGGDRDLAPVDGALDGDARGCADLKADFNAVLETLDRACDVVADCVLIGEIQGCNGDPHLATNCAGAPVQRAAYDAARESTLAPILAAMAEAGCDYSDRAICQEINCTFDCSPGILGCSDAGRCVVTETNYCWEPADAGVAP